MHRYFIYVILLSLLVPTLAGCTRSDDDDPEIPLPEIPQTVYDRIWRGLWYCAYDAKGTAMAMQGSYAETPSVDYAHVLDVYQFDSKTQGHFCRYFFSDDEVPRLVMRWGDNYSAKFSYTTNSFDASIHIELDNEWTPHYPKQQVFHLSGNTTISAQGLNGGITLQEGWIKNYPFLLEEWNRLSQENIEEAYDPDYFNEFKTEEDNHDWMSRLDGQRLVADLSIPGAHNAATAEPWTGFDAWGPCRYNYGNLTGRTQDLTVEELWKAGVRAFTFSFQLDEDGELRCHSGSVATTMLASDAFRRLTSLVSQNPTEFAIVVADKPQGEGSQISKWGQQFNRLLHSEEYNGMFAQFDARLTVDELRGKILVFSPYKYSTWPVGAFFENWSRSPFFEEQQKGMIVNLKGTRSPLWIQDEEVYGHSESGFSVRNMLKEATSRDMGAELPVWVFNFASSCNRSGASDTYRANAEEKNMVAFNFLNNEYNVGPVGILFADFAGVDQSRGYTGITVHPTQGMELVKALIQQNFKQKPTE